MNQRLAMLERCDRRATNRSSWVRAEAIRNEQMALRRSHRVVFLGIGPSVASGGWSVGPAEWVRCTVCGYLIHLDGGSTDTCWCGAMHCYASAGRIGSELGDHAIERVRLEPVEPA